MMMTIVWFHLDYIGRIRPRTMRDKMAASLLQSSKINISDYFIEDEIILEYLDERVFTYMSRAGPSFLP